MIFNKPAKVYSILIIVSDLTSVYMPGKYSYLAYSLLFMNNGKNFDDIVFNKLSKNQIIKLDYLDK